MKELNICHTVEFSLVYWPEEQQVSMVARSRLDGGAAVGDVCSLKLGRSKHQGKVIEIGRFNILEVIKNFKVFAGRLFTSIFTIEIYNCTFWYV